MELTELQRDILRFALDYTYEYLSDLHVNYKRQVEGLVNEYKEIDAVAEIEDQLEALKTLRENKCLKGKLT